MNIAFAPFAFLAYFLTFPLALFALISIIKSADRLPPLGGAIYGLTVLGAPIYLGVALISLIAGFCKGHRHVAFFYVVLAGVSLGLIYMSLPAQPVAKASDLTELYLFAPAILFAAAAHESVF